MFIALRTANGFVWAAMKGETLKYFGELSNPYDLGASATYGLQTIIGDAVLVR